MLTLCVFGHQGGEGFDGRWRLGPAEWLLQQSLTNSQPCSNSLLLRPGRTTLGLKFMKKLLSRVGSAFAHGLADDPTPAPSAATTPSVGATYARTFSALSLTCLAGPT